MGVEVGLGVRWGWWLGLGHLEMFPLAYDKLYSIDIKGALVRAQMLFQTFDNHDAICAVKYV